MHMLPLLLHFFPSFLDHVNPFSLVPHKRFRMIVPRGLTRLSFLLPGLAQRAEFPNPVFLLKSDKRLPQISLVLSLDLRLLAPRELLGILARLAVTLKRPFDEGGRLDGFLLQFLLDCLRKIVFGDVLFGGVSGRCEFADLSSALRVLERNLDFLSVAVAWKAWFGKCSFFRQGSALVDRRVLF